MLFHRNFWSFRNLNGKQLFRTTQLRADQTNSENKHSFSNHMFDKMYSMQSRALCSGMFLYCTIFRCNSMYIETLKHFYIHSLIT